MSESAFFRTSSRGVVLRVADRFFSGDAGMGRCSGHYSRPVEAGIDLHVTQIRCIIRQIRDTLKSSDFSWKNAHVSFIAANL